MVILRDCGSRDSGSNLGPGLLITNFKLIFRIISNFQIVLQFILQIAGKNTYKWFEKILIMVLP